MSQLLKALRGCLLIGISSLPFICYAADPDMVLITHGEFIMGTGEGGNSDKAKEFGAAKPWYVDERPRRIMKLNAFWLDTFEITNKAYSDFVVRSNYSLPQTWAENGYLLTNELLKIASVEKLRQLATETFRLDIDVRGMNKEQLLTAISKQRQGLDSLPVTGISWKNAHDYCLWSGKRLPSEVEWEKAARGELGLEYPWGNAWDATKLNSGGGGDWEYGVAPVGSYPKGKSPYGVYDMAGNVMEWVEDWYQPYPGSKYQSKAFGNTYKVVRGGGFGGMGHYAIEHFYRNAYRFYLTPESGFNDVGFRCAKDAS